MAGKKEEFEKIEQNEIEIAALKKTIADLESKLAHSHHQNEDHYKRINELEQEKGRSSNFVLYF